MTDPSWRALPPPVAELRFRSPDRGAFWRPDATLAWDGQRRCAIHAAQTAIAAFDSAERLVKSTYLAQRLRRITEDDKTDQTGAGRSLSISAIGACSLSGRVRAYEKGYRAELARIERVWTVGDADERYVRAAARTSGVTYMGRLQLDDLLGDSSALAAIACRMQRCLHTRTATTAFTTPSLRSWR